MSIRVNPNGKPIIRNLKHKAQLPKGVTMTAQRIKERIICRPDNGAYVYPVDAGKYVAIERLSREESHRLMALLLEEEGLEYIGFDIGRVLYPSSVEKVS